MMSHNQECLNNNSPFAITVTLACPIFCPSSDTIQVYTTLVNSASTVIVSPCSDWLDQCHVMFASDWSVWHVRVTLSSWHRVSKPSLGDDVIVTFVELAVTRAAVTKLAAVYYIYTNIALFTHLNEYKPPVNKATTKCAVTLLLGLINTQAELDKKGRRTQANSGSRPFQSLYNACHEKPA